MAAVSFIGLNLLDAWLTHTALSLGAIELNPVAALYGANIVAKGLIATTAVLALYRFGKEHLLWWMNFILVGIVAWNLQLCAFLTALQINWAGI